MEVYLAIWSKCLIVHPLFLGEPSHHELHFELLNAAICCMLDLVESLGTYYRLPLRPWYYVPNIILHDGDVLLHHGILPYLLVCCCLKDERIEILVVAHQCHIVWKPHRRSSFSKCVLRSLHILLSIPQCLSEPLRSLDRSGRGYCLLLFT
jgi:hypothetical protein